MATQSTWGRLEVKKMVKHNNALPNVHLHKYWQRHVENHFDQKAKQKKRALTRNKKAAAKGLAPLNPLRPIVQCSSPRYNMKSREGTGFTALELEAAGISPKYARTIGISTDKRRKNRNEEHFQRNVDRIKQYISKLVIFPKKGKKASKNRGGLPDDITMDKAKSLTLNDVQKCPAFFAISKFN